MGTQDRDSRSGAVTQTLPQACTAVAAEMISWWFRMTPWARDLFRSWAPLADSEDTGPVAATLLLGAVLHHQAVTDGVTVDTIDDLVFTRVRPILEDPEQAVRVLREYPDPPALTGFVAPVRRRAQEDREFLAALCSYTRHTVAAHAEDCPDRLPGIRHTCTLAHRAPAFTPDTEAHDAAPAPGEGRLIDFPLIGYREPEPAEDAPAGHSPHHIWQVNVREILLERWDDWAAARNQRDYDAFSGDRPLEFETGLEAFTCPSCGSRGPYLAEGRWDDPLTLYCGCGVTVMSSADSRPDDLGRLLLKRLILCAADPAYAARRLLAPVTAHHEDQRRAWATTSYTGPSSDEVAIVEDVADCDGDLTEVPPAALRPKLPKRHSGGALTLLLLQVLDALSVPAVRDSKDGRELSGAVRTLLADLKAESDRWAPARRPAVDRLREWQAEGGPQLWQDAWSRILAMADRFMAGNIVSDGSSTDGCAALTLAVYLPARETGTGADKVTMEDIHSLAAPVVPAGSLAARAESDDALKDPDLPRRWGERLRTLGHDLDSADDPVAALWRHLSADRPTDILGEHRAPALAIGLRTLLDPWSPSRITL
ncbi:hypothetical protein [Streptomyces acidiscabies]|uniref:Uncharacterized protein n=1 Tax=Streptomyces acidiscabies TaxID=42234 RepID=A0ABU4MAH7_9ACTN|nr:hypothetical protein [Streptomyces acidiscabies]MDX3025000.1 hypothetical protein [Streptomyces acidiscabies]